MAVWVDLKLKPRQLSSASLAFTCAMQHGYRRIARFAWIAKLRLRKYLI
jgi:hypothetical protein